MGDLVTRLNDGYGAYQAAIGEAYLRFRAAAAEAEQRWLAELYTTRASDDAAERVNQAWRRYQLDMAKLSYESWTELAEKRRDLAAVIGDAHAESVKTAYENAVTVAEAQADSVKMAYERYVDAVGAGDAGGGRGKAAAASEKATPRSTTRRGRRPQPAKSSG
jgi:hypothetical protein